MARRRGPRSNFTFDRGAPATAADPAGAGSQTEEHLRTALAERALTRYRVDTVSEPGNLIVLVQLSGGAAARDVLSYKRLNTSTTYIFILWMIGSSLVLFVVAAIFLRNQVKSLRRLAAAADGFGKGRPVAYSKVEGALEVRQAAVAFIQMRDRIQRQIRQRTEIAGSACRMICARH